MKKIAPLLITGGLLQACATSSVDQYYQDNMKVGKKTRQESSALMLLLNNSPDETTASKQELMTYRERVCKAASKKSLREEPNAIFILAQCGTNAVPNYQLSEYEACKLYKKSASFSKPFSLISQAQYSTGRCYGRGFTKNDKEAVKWFELAANNEHAYAQYLLGYHFYWGEGVMKDRESALYWFRQSAAQNIPQAELYLGRHYHYGTGVEQDYIQSFYWFEKAADKGNREAQFRLAKSYKLGFGTQINMEKSTYWYLEAANQGHQEAGLITAKNYQYGTGTKKDLSKAFDWYLALAKQDYEEAFLPLAEAYREGKGTNKNFVEAFNWYFKASSESDLAQYYLGRFFYLGQGTEADEERAKMWLTLAKDNGNANARKLLDEINQSNL